MNSHSKIKKNFIYNAFYQILVMVVPLIVSPYISRTLGSNMIGVYAYANSWAMYFVLFTTLGLNNYGNRTIAISRANKILLSKTFCEIYTMQLVISMIMISLYILYVICFSNNLIAWMLIFYVISAGLDITWFFFGIEEFKIVLFRNSIIKIVTTVLIFIFVKTSKDIYIYTAIMSISLFVTQAFVFPFVKKYISLTKVKLKDVLVHVKPNLILFLPIVAVSVYTILDKIMLGYFSVDRELGFYQNAETLINVPIALTNALGIVMLPRISNILMNNKNDNVEIYIPWSIKIVMIISSSMCFGIMGISNEFVPIFFGDGYKKCIILLQILLPSCIFIAFSNVIRTQFIIPMKKDKILIVSVFIGAIFNIVINLLVVPRLASIGSSIATLISEAVVCIVQCYMSKKYLDIMKYVKIALPILSVGIVMYIILLQINLCINIYILLLFKIMIGIVIYLIGIGCYYYYYKYKEKSKKI